MSDIRFLISGDSSLTMELGQKIDPIVNARVRAAKLLLQQEQIPGELETVPTYCALTIHYDPLQISCPALCRRLESLLSRLDQAQLPASNVWVIPVCYGGALGPDLKFVAQHCGMTEEEVIRLHSTPEYLIYMLGFTPGFPYLGGMPSELSTPRLSEPRVRIPAGSVGIAGGQTGIYPIDSPGGWQLIGRTPVRLYDPARPSPILLQAGDFLKFHPVLQEEFDAIAASVANGTYCCPSYQKGGVS